MPMGNEVISLTIENRDNEKEFLSAMEKIELVKKINHDQSKITLFASKGN